MLTAEEARKALEQKANLIEEFLLDTQRDISFAVKKQIYHLRGFMEYDYIVPYPIHFDQTKNVLAILQERLRDAGYIVSLKGTIYNKEYVIHELTIKWI